jgi:hypothetical protein
MDKNTHSKGLGYMTKEWLWGWSLMMTCGDVWYIPHSYNLYLIWQGGTQISLTCVQQQQGSVQEIWGESRWVRAPQQGEVDVATPLTQRRTYQEQC